MARTVVYAGTNADQARDPDGPASKIAKYVPAELIAISTLFFSSFTITGRTIWVVVAIGAVLNVVYLLSVSMSAKDTPSPKLYFYVLSAVAFVLWSMATIDVVAKEAGLSGSTSDGQRAFVLAFAAFAMPALDTLFSSVKLGKK
ncbi:hypothetical protein GCM10027596_30950 [Nocardioides korecus]